MSGSGIRPRLPGQQFALLDRFRGISCRHRPGVNVGKDARARTYDSAVPDTNAGRNKHIGRNPRVLTNRDRRSDKRHCRISIVVASGTKETVLTDYCMRPYHDLRHTITVHVLAQTTMSTHLQVPGCPDTSARIRSEEHTSELQSQSNLVCRLLLE